MNYIKKTTYLIALVLFVNNTNAQFKPLRIGYTNVDYVLSLMPESKKIESELKTYKTQLEKQAKEKYEEYQTKLQAYQKEADKLADAIKASKERELVNLQQEIQEFQQDAESSLQKKQQTALEPVLEKLQKAIDIVAEKNHFDYVLNSDAGYGSTPILLHGPKEDNVTELVLKELGITPPPTTEKTTTPEKKK